MDHWFHGDQAVSDEMEDDARAYGIILEVPRDPIIFEVWPEHWDVVNMFLDVQTQWRVGSGGLIGLDYGVVLSLASLYGLDARDLLDDLRVMEDRAKELVNGSLK